MKKIPFLILTLLLITNSSCNEDDSIIKDFYMYPNPFDTSSNSEANFKTIFSKSISGQLSITVYNRAKITVWNNSKTINTTSEETIKWTARNNSGKKLTPGIYYAKVSLKGSYSSEKTIEIITN